MSREIFIYEDSNGNDSNGNGLELLNMKTETITLAEILPSVDFIGYQPMRGEGAYYSRTRLTYDAEAGVNTHWITSPLAGVNQEGKGISEARMLERFKDFRLYRADNNKYKGSISNNTLTVTLTEPDADGLECHPHPKHQHQPLTMNLLSEIATFNQSVQTHRNQAGLLSSSPPVAEPTT